MALATSRYKQIQLGAGDYRADDFKKAKDDLSERQAKLKATLNNLLRKWDYSDVSDTDWVNNYAPFHWVSEFYSIIVENGGFDVIIGNPPYVEYSARNTYYRINKMQTISCKDLYAFITEKAEKILSNIGYISMITPISIISTDGFLPLRKLMYEKFGYLWFSSYSMRPAKLFDGVDKHLTIYLANRDKKKALFSSKYYRWNAEFRPYLFNTINYTPIIESLLHNTSIPKIGNEIEASIMSKLWEQRQMRTCTINNSEHAVYHTRKLRYFVQFLDVAPKIFEENGNVRTTSELKKICYRTNKERLLANAAFLSSLFFWYYISYSDCRNLNRREVLSFPFDMNMVIRSSISKQMIDLSIVLLHNLQNNSYMKKVNYQKHGLLDLQIFQPRMSKSITDRIDTILAKYYGFTEEELDYIINYDIKYRMGIGDGDGEVDE